MAFIDQAAADIKRMLQRLDGLRRYSLQDLVKETEKVYKKLREKKKKRELRKKKESREKIKKEERKSREKLGKRKRKQKKIKEQEQRED